MTGTIRTLIVDDEPLALDRLRFAFRDMPDVEVIGDASDGIQAIEQIRALKPDLVILDIQMPGRSGLSVAEELREDTRTEVVFVTAYEHFAPDAFDVDAADYLVKPVRIDRLRRAIERVRRRRGQAQPVSNTPTIEAAESFLVPDRKGGIRVAISLIEWIEAAKDYALLHTATKSHMVRMTMAELEAQVDPAVMIRVHRSAIVRLDAVADVRRHARGSMLLTLRDGTELAVGPSYSRVVDKALLQRS